MAQRPRRAACHMSHEKRVRDFSFTLKQMRLVSLVLVYGATTNEPPPKFRVMNKEKSCCVELEGGSRVASHWPTNHRRSFTVFSAGSWLSIEPTHTAPSLAFLFFLFFRRDMSGDMSSHVAAGRYL